MSYSIAIVLFVLWMAGLAAGLAFPGLIHTLLVVAIILVVMDLILRDPSLMARYMAISSLGRFGAEAGMAIPAIVPLLQDSDEYVRRFATNALCDIAPNTFKRPTTAPWAD